MKKINIIGAGILGAATAFELAKRGHKITIFEQKKKGRATSAAAGIICPWISKRRNQDWYELAKGGAAYYPFLIDELYRYGELSTGYKQVGAIRLHEDKNKIEELYEIAMTRKQDAPEIGDIAILNEAETHKQFPFLTNKFHSLFISGAARVDGNALRNSLLQATTTKYDTTLISEEAELLVEDNSIQGVVSNDISYPADITIAVNGVWMNALLKQLQPGIHFQAQKGEILHLNADTDTAGLPVVIPPNNQYMLPFDNGRVIVGATHETAHDLNPKLSAGGVHYMLDQALKFAPDLFHAEIVDARVGFRPFTKNHLPVFGLLPNYANLLIANGLGASGLTTGPFIAKQLAQFVSGEDLDVDMAKFDVRLGI